MTAEVKKPDHRGLNHVFKAFGYSMQGLQAAIVNEEAFRLELIAFIIMFPLGLWLGEGAVEKVLLTSCLFLVLIVELINSAVEAVVDRIGVEHHVLAGRAKDIGSAAVFMSLVVTGLTWGLILYEKFVH